MKKTFYILSLIWLCSLVGTAQNVRSTYFLNEWSQRHTLNASFAPEHGNLALPIIGGVNFDIASNTGLSNYLFHYNSELVTFLHPSVDGTAFLNNLNPVEYLNQSMSLNLFALGFKTKNAYWSIDATFRENVNVNLPYDLFRLMKNAHQSSTNLFDLKNFSSEQSNIGELTLGYSRDINSKIRVGGNIKFLVGLSSEKINYNKFDITMNNDKFMIDAVGESMVKSTIIGFVKDENNYFDFTQPKVDLSFKMPAGLGIGIDLGITYKPIEQLTLAAAINNLGGISWNASGIKKGLAQTNFTFTGFTIVSLDSININSQLSQLEKDAGNLIKFQEQPAVTKGIFESLPYTINASAEYSIFNNKKHDIRIGLLWNSYNTSSSHTNEIMAALNFKPFSWFTISSTYAFLRNDNNRLGLALNFSPKMFNFFIASDFITNRLNPQFLPVNKFDINLQTGISFYVGQDY